MKRIAVVTIRKRGDVHTSDMETITAHAVFDRQLLMDQLELCIPTIIVSGSSAKPFTTLPTKQSERLSTDHLIQNDHDTIVLDYMVLHPTIGVFFGFRKNGAL